MDRRLAALAAHGQSVWVDTIDRALIDDGGLAALIDKGVTGVTTNPTIFHKAIASGNRYDDSIRGWLARHPDGDTEALLEQLMIEDVAAAADLLREVYDRSGGEDGYVSLEVSPLLAHDTQATQAAARRLFDALDRPNVMIKIPATPAGLPAIETMLADGVNINITLLFALPRYRQVLEAHSRALARLASPGSVASVASFFVSRIDTKIDAALEQIGSDEALALRGRIACACAKQAYQLFSQHIDSPAFAQLAARGAQVQRLLWGSTGTKNPAYSDVLYVDNLIGRHTVNTLPLATLEAFLDHGAVSASLLQEVEQAEQDLAALQRLGISMETVTDALEAEGVAAFAESYRALLEALAAKREALA